MADDKLPYLALILPGLVVAGFAVYLLLRSGRRTSRLEGLGVFLQGERLTGLGTSLALFFGFSTPFFRGAWRGLKFEIVEKSNRSGTALSLVFPADLRFCLTFADWQKPQAPRTGPDFGDMKELLPGLWAEHYTVTTDNSYAAAEYLAAESVQQALKKLAAAGYGVTVGMLSVKASRWAGGWTGDPEGTEQDLLARENLVPALDALYTLVKACPKPSAPRRD